MATAIESDYLPVDHSLIRQRLERADQLRETLREILSIARRQMDAIAGLEGDRPIAVELQFLFPFRSRRHFGYGETRHRLNEMTDRSFRPTLSTYETLSTTLHLHFSVFPSHEFPQSALEAHFGGRSTLRLQPLLELPNPDLMLDSRLSDHNRDRRLTSANIIHPFVLAKRW